MTQTAERIATLINEGVDCVGSGLVGVPHVAAIIAAEIDRLIAERDEARAEVERLRLPAEAWEKGEILRKAPYNTPLNKLDRMQDDAREYAARARAAKGEK